MTDLRLKRLKEKLTASRERLLKSQTLFGLLLMNIKFVAMPFEKQISTNGKCIFFSPDYIEKLRNYELDYMLCHQILHIILGHINRLGTLGGDNYHLACDIEINCILKLQMFENDSYPHLGLLPTKLAGEQFNATEESAQEIYARLPFDLTALTEKGRDKYLPDTDFWWDYKENDGKYGEIVLDNNCDDFLLRFSNDSGGGNGKGLWEQNLQMAAAMLKQLNKKQYDDIPDNIKRIINGIVKSKLDWKKLLDEFIMENANDYSFTPPDKRFSDWDFFLPDFNDTDTECKQVLFMVDTSGSVEDEQLAKVYSEIYAVIEQYGGRFSGLVGFFDAKVQSVTPFEAQRDFLKIIPTGGGGTDFRCIFDYIGREMTNSLPACVVVFTDGDGPYPEKTATLDLPILWLLDSEVFSHKVPFGKAVVM